MSHASIEGEFAAAICEPAMPVPAWALSPKGSVDRKRFAVYRNNVHVGLVAALRSKFPVTQRLVGTDFFGAMARIYVGLHKPASPLLADYGTTFPQFIAEFEPARAVPFLADVARLEDAWTASYHSAEAEPLSAAVLAALPPDRLPSVRLRSHPATRLVASEYAIGSIWSANQLDTVVPVQPFAPEAVLVTRPHAEVTLRTISIADHCFCKALLEGSSIELAASVAWEAASAFDLPAALTGLVGAGVFAAIEPGESQ